MGLIISSWLEDWVGQFFKPTTMLILGLDNAGKTQILYCMKLGEAITNVIPTLGFNIEEVTYKNLTFKAWDLGGQTKFRQMWHHYYECTDAVIFVIDSNDRDRFHESKQELHALLDQECLRNAPFLIFANKQDLPNAADTNEIVTKLRLFTLLRHREWKVCESTATTGNGIDRGFQWLSGQV